MRSSLFAKLYAFSVICHTLCSYKVAELKGGIFNSGTKCNFPRFFNKLTDSNADVYFTQKFKNDRSDDSDKQITLAQGIRLQIILTVYCLGRLFNSYEVCGNMGMCDVEVTAPGIVKKSVVTQKPHVIVEADISYSVVQNENFDNKNLQMKIIVSGFGGYLEFTPIPFYFSGMVTTNSILTLNAGNESVLDREVFVRPGDQIKCMIQCMGYPPGSGWRSGKSGKRGKASGPVECLPNQFQLPEMWDLESGEAQPLVQGEEFGRFDRNYQSSVLDRGKSNFLYINYRPGNLNENKRICFSVKVATEYLGISGGSPGGDIDGSQKACVRYTSQSRVGIFWIVLFVLLVVVGVFFASRM